MNEGGEERAHREEMILEGNEEDSDGVKREGMMIRLKTRDVWKIRGEKVGKEGSRRESCRKVKTGE